MSLWPGWSATDDYQLFTFSLNSLSSLQIVRRHRQSVCSPYRGCCTQSTHAACVFANRLDWWPVCMQANCRRTQERNITALRLAVLPTPLHPSFLPPEILYYRSEGRQQPTGINQHDDVATNGLRAQRSKTRGLDQLAADHYRPELTTN